uniref:G_PROTEIN_RECEP_F1_2 domain-containing protein n=1 Tax=Syphacia muris TaxID=451379 RepID=A0A0N5AN93_9BILA
MEPSVSKAIPTAPPYMESSSSSSHRSLVHTLELPPTYEATVNASDALPPTYESIYGEFRQVQDSKGFVRVLGKALKFILNTVAVAVTIGLLNVVPLTMVILGSMNLHMCKVQPMIPIWILVSGIFLLLKSAINFFRMKVRSNNGAQLNALEEQAQKRCKNPFTFILTFLGIFFIIWFIIGSVWVYGAYKKVEYNKNSLHYCDHFMYVFSFVYTTSVYIVSFLTMCCCALPPTYQSLYGEFRRVDDPKSLAQFLGKAFTALINTVTAAVTIAFLNIIPLFMIVIGVINLENCQIEPRIPIWLIVGGSVYLLKSAINFFRMKVYKDRLNRQNPPDQNVPRGCRNPFKLVLSLLALFSVIWFVIGTVLVYRVYSSVNYEDEQSSDHCDQFIYLFSFCAASVVAVVVCALEERNLLTTKEFVQFNRNQSSFFT